MSEVAADQDELLDALEGENDLLRTRIVHLEATIEEYRRQMGEVLTSSSWRATAPLRNIAGHGRLVRRRLRRLPGRLTSSGSGGTTFATATTGLFPPDPPAPGGLVTPATPLLARPFPSSRTEQPRLQKLPSDARVLVVAHVYYPEVWFDIENRLVRIPEPFDLIVSLIDDRAQALETEITSRRPDAMIHHADNYGRDFGSLLELANAGVFGGYDAILKVHTKRSPHRFDGDAWRVSLLDGLLPSPEGVRRMIDLLRRDRSVGVIAPSGHVRGAETWGSDQPLVEALAARLPLAFDPDVLRYPAGSMYWARPWVLQRLADLRLGREHFEEEGGHLDGSTSHALERFVGVATQASGLEIVETDDVASRLHRVQRRRSRRPTVLAFYLPQFHRTPENDAWWGPGFTDWVKLDGARPLYDGHRLPTQPRELGRYDLSDPEVMRSQAAIAAEHAVDGFVMYHYWFDGRSLLDTPLRNLLNDPTIEFPFALCWANENWTRRWDGLDSDVLISQSYREGWADRFYEDLVPALSDHRYITVDGKRLLVLYRIGHMPNARATIERWKGRARDDGLGGLHVLAVNHDRNFEHLPGGVGDIVDGLVQFPPLSGIGLQSVGHLAPGLSPDCTGKIYSYAAAADGAAIAATESKGLRLHPGVMPGWDNTPRRGAAAYVFHGSNPLTFRRWVAQAAATAVSSGGPPLLFINAWNEWAEGAYLEPDARFGRAYLEAIRDAVGLASPTERELASSAESLAR